MNSTEDDAIFEESGNNSSDKSNMKGNINKTDSTNNEDIN